jgi:hypothetical protein
MYYILYITSLFAGSQGALQNTLATTNTSIINKIAHTRTSLCRNSINVLARGVLKNFKCIDEAAASTTTWKHRTAL